MKGFAILCVVFGHVILFCLKCQQDNFVYHVVTSFHMPLFALMSGLMFKPVLGWAKATSKLASQSLKLLLPFPRWACSTPILCWDMGGRIYPKWSEDGILVSVLPMAVLSHHTYL